MNSVRPISAALADLDKQIADAVKTAVASALNESGDHRRLAELRTAIWAQPMITVPQDVQVLAGCGRSAAYELMKASDFPPVARIGGTNLVATADFAAMLKGRKRPWPKPTD